VPSIQWDWGGIEGDHPGARLVVRTKIGQAKQRKLYRLSCSPRIAFGVHDGCHSNLLRAVLERVFYVEEGGQFLPPPAPEEGAWTALDYVGRLIVHYVGYPRSLTREEFVETSRPQKRQLYRNAVDSLKLSKVSRADAEVHGFVKCEKLDFEAKVDPAPRLIQPRDPRYNVAVGVYLRPLEHKVYHAIDVLFYTRGCHKHTVAKGHNFAKRGRILQEKFSRFKRPRALAFDARRFDQHVSVDALRFEHRVYVGCFQGHRLLAWLLSWQLRTIFSSKTADGSVRFEKDGGRCSGDMNTALGNVLIVCCLLYHLTRGFDVEVYDDGDDFVLICEEEDVARLTALITEGFLRYGFVLTMGPTASVLEKIEFCKTQPVFDGVRWTMIRDPRTALAKDACTTLPVLGAKTVQSYLAAVGECGESVAGGMPIWNSFYSALKRESGGVAPGRFPELETGMWWNSRGMRRRFGAVSTAARVSFWRAFDLTPAEQEVTERYFDGWRYAGDVLNSYGPPWGLTDYLLGTVLLPLRR